MYPTQPSRINLLGGRSPTHAATNNSSFTNRLSKNTTRARTSAAGQRSDFGPEKQSTFLLSTLTYCSTCSSVVALTTWLF